MQHDDCENKGEGQCEDGGERDCDERGTSNCRKQGGRGRGDGQCRRGHGAHEADVQAPVGVEHSPGVQGRAAGALRIAVCATGPTFADRVHERFGRAECFQLIDSTTLTTLVVGNDVNRAGSSGAGIGAVELISDNGAGVVIATKVGPKATEAFRKAHIPVYEAGGMTVGEAVEAFLRSELTRLDEI